MSELLPALPPPAKAYQAATLDAVFRTLCAELDVLTAELAAAEKSAERAEARAAELDLDQTLAARAVARTTTILEARRRVGEADSRAIVAEAREEAARRARAASAEADAILAGVEARESHALEMHALPVESRELVASDAGVHEEFWREAREADSSAMRRLPTYALLQAGAVLLLLGMVLVLIG